MEAELKNSVPEWPTRCRFCGNLLCTGLVVAGLGVAGVAHATCTGDRCDTSDLGRVPMPQVWVTGTSTAGPSDAVAVYNNVTDEKLEFAVLNAKTYQRYDIEASAAATVTSFLTST